MSRITTTDEITRDQLRDAPDDQWIDDLISAQNEINRQVIRSFNGQIDISSNTTSGFIDLKMKHGVQYTVRNPLRVPIQGIVPIKAVGLGVNSDGSLTRAVYQIGTPQLQWSPTGKPDGSVYVTSQFDQANTAPYLAKSVTFTVPSGGAENTITGWTTEDSRTSIISESSGTWTVLEAGTYIIECFGRFEVGVGSYDRILLGINSTSSPFIGVLARTDIQAALTPSGPNVTCSTVYKFPSNAKFVVTSYQQNGVASSRNIPFYARVSRLYNDSTPLASVRLLFVGG